MIITELTIYPVKALGGIRLTHSTLGVTGLPWDRHWMLVDSAGRFVTQRQLPALAAIRPSLDEHQLVLQHPQQPSLTIPLQRELSELTPVSLWQSELEAFDEGAEAADWLTRLLGEYRGAPLRLVRFNRAQSRPIKAKYLEPGETSHTEFADGFPFLIASRQSLAALNAALEANGEAPVGMERFRANIVVDELDGAFSELNEYRLEGAGYTLAIRKPCQRCPVITVDQASGTRPNPKEPLRTLLSLNPLTKPGAFFGGNAVLLTGEGEGIRVGDVLAAKAGR
ncbi:MOSC N-terminal beta barrel domain-containing protein [Ferrimonas balearica]|uniref:MOSC domain-containing protein n=1 Tax=Ferrimonas balearica TaxID=44012 RepID=UPI001C58EA92|nr:MOSC N-terminal beta barrel domain-containing protein [Ferrimonas balearica]MBW3139650.1 MOSC N-terminal beta barrel domain-containing protein [Ferrimonas balearica]